MRDNVDEAAVEACALFLADAARSGAAKVVWSPPQPPRVVGYVPPVPAVVIMPSRSWRRRALVHLRIRTVLSVFARLVGVTW